MNIVELAQSLNLSIGTVSRALNDRPEVSAITRRRVLAKAQEMNFAPNPNARRLVTGKNCLIQFDCPNNASVLADPFLVQLAGAVGTAAGEHGYDLQLHLGASQRALLPVNHKAVDGLLLVAAPETRAEDLRLLTGDGKIPTAVICGPDPLDFPACSYVCLSTLQGVREALELLANQGHRRVGYIGSGLAGCRVRPVFPALARAAGLDWDGALALDAGVLQENGFWAASALLGRSSAPTALFARTDVLAVGAIHAAQQRGLRVPEDVSVIGHDDIEFATLVSPPLTTVGIDTALAGRTAINALMEMLERQAAPTVQTIHAHLVLRQSAGPCARLAA